VLITGFGNSFCNFVKMIVMKELIFIVEEAPEGGYTAKALGECIYTEADSIVELKEMLKDAVVCHFETNELPKLVRLHIVKEETISIAI
jgi:hypothetical protein